MLTVAWLTLYRMRLKYLYDLTTKGFRMIAFVKCISLFSEIGILRCIDANLA